MVLLLGDDCLLTVHWTDGQTDAVQYTICMHVRCIMRRAVIKD